MESLLESVKYSSTFYERRILGACERRVILSIVGFLSNVSCKLLTLAPLPSLTVGSCCINAPFFSPRGVIFPTTAVVPSDSTPESCLDDRRCLRGFLALAIISCSTLSTLLLRHTLGNVPSGTMFSSLLLDRRATRRGGGIHWSMRMLLLLLLLLIVHFECFLDTFDF